MPLFAIQRKIVAYKGQRWPFWRLAGPFTTAKIVSDFRLFPSGKFDSTYSLSGKFGSTMQEDQYSGGSTLPKFQRLRHELCLGDQWIQPQPS